MTAIAQKYKIDRVTKVTNIKKYTVTIVILYFCAAQVREANRERSLLTNSQSEKSV